MRNKKRVLLINPPFYRLMNSHFNGLTLGLSYIAAVLSKNGQEIQYYNQNDGKFYRIDQNGNSILLSEHFIKLKILHRRLVQIRLFWNILMDQIFYMILMKESRLV